MERPRLFIFYKPSQHYILPQATGNSLHLRKRGEEETYKETPVLCARWWWWCGRSAAGREAEGPRATRNIDLQVGELLTVGQEASLSLLPHPPPPPTSPAPLPPPPSPSTSKHPTSVYGMYIYASSPDILLSA